MHVAQNKQMRRLWRPRRTLSVTRTADGRAACSLQHLPSLDRLRPKLGATQTQLRHTRPGTDRLGQLEADLDQRLRPNLAEVGDTLADFEDWADFGKFCSDLDQTLADFDTRSRPTPSLCRPNLGLAQDYAEHGTVSVRTRLVSGRLRPKPARIRTGAGQIWAGFDHIRGLGSTPG